MATKTKAPEAQVSLNIDQIEGLLFKLQFDRHAGETRRLLEKARESLLTPAQVRAERIFDLAAKREAKAYAAG